MDFLYTIHLLFLLITLSIPFWRKKYLQWGVYIPFLTAITWVIFDGCPITNIQTNLAGDTFVRNLLANINSNITNQQADHIIFFTYLLITIVGFIRLCNFTPNIVDLF